MPELPEVETVRRGLAPYLEGRVLTRVELRRPDLRFPFPADFVTRLEGRRIETVGRRAKYLVVTCAPGEAARRTNQASVLLAHLGMSGRFTILDPAAGTQAPGEFVHRAAETGITGEGPHDHVVFTTEAGVRIVYTDHRRFGMMTVCDEDAWTGHDWLVRLGIEPLDPAFDAAYLMERLGSRRSPLKAGLLDQTVVAGLGNIYVCEALYRARLSPRRSCHTLGPARAARLVTAIREVIGEAIEAGGSTLRDYAQADGALGYFQHRFRAYGREGETCPDRGCGPVRRIVQSGRSTFFCPGCQR